ncbi:helix-turn-helix domain-containing protein [Pedobacter sp. N23S346]|uniref:helix-turn-helix domain-containing protein n=1 Tax=Pedobacter sp. N23S346 TaxID=3402750 RepID=UPI003AF04317
MQNSTTKSRMFELEEELDKSGGMVVNSQVELLPVFALNEPFRSNSFAVVVTKKGSMSLNYDFVSYDLTEKEVFFVVPDAMFEIITMSADVEFLCLSFQRDYLKKQGIFMNSGEIMQVFSESAIRKVALSPEEYQEMTFHITALGRKLALPDHTPHIKEIIRHTFLSVFYEVVLVNGKYWSGNPVQQNRKEELTSDFLLILAENFKTERRIEFYSKALYVTPRHLSQVVKQVTGKTAGEFIDEMVIREAKVLLSAHVLNVGQVAFELCFSDQSFFGKYFKKYTGISPSQYRAISSIAQNPPF